MTAVVVLGEIPTAGVIRQVSADRGRLDASVSSEAALDFVAYAAQGLHQRKAVLALYPAWRSTEGKRFVQLARGTLDTDRVAGIPLNLPPLALSLVADQLAYVAQHVSPGLLASLAYRLPYEILAGAWVNSVAKLEHIQTSLRKHVTSYLPGTGFMVAAAPYEVVHRITTGDPIARVSFRPADPVLMLAAREDGDAEWLQQTFQPALGATSMTFVQAQPLSSEFWGTKKYVEFVAFSGHPYALQNAIRATPCRPCPWCGESIALDTCPFCAMVQPAPHVDQVRPEEGPAGAPERPTPPAQQSPPPAGPGQQPRPPERPQHHVPQPQAQPQVQPQARPAGYSWYEQPSSPQEPPPRPRPQPPAATRSEDRDGGDDRHAWEERSHTVTFAVPHRQPRHGANGAAPMLDPPESSNGASSAH